MTRISETSGTGANYVRNDRVRFEAMPFHVSRGAQPATHASLIPSPSVPQANHRLRLVSGHRAKIDRIWATVRHEARAIVESDRAMARCISNSVLDQERLEDAIANRIAQRLSTPELRAAAIYDTFRNALAEEPQIADAMRSDLLAAHGRDPACDRYIEPLLYFKGYHALQAHRLVHQIWNRGRRDFALWLQSRSSEVFQTDIHPAARIGTGILLDHATGLVVGSTAVIDDDVSLLHEVTLGGTGKNVGDRHPKIKRGVLIGAGAKILGNITVGTCAKVGAGSVVLHNVPANTTVAGVPAKVVGGAGTIPPASTMDHMLTEGS